MPILFFIRHGETNANVDGILTGTLETNLTQKGVDDAKRLSLQLVDEFDYYYCSPLKRTHQTLNAIKGEVDFNIDDRLTEVSTGKWQGKYKTELPKDEYTLYKKGLLDPPGGEKLIDVDNRIKSFLNDMFNLYSENEKILIVTHNAFIRSLKRLFIDKEKVEEPKNLEIFKIDNEMYQKMLEKNKNS